MDELTVFSSPLKVISRFNARKMQLIAKNRMYIYGRKQITALYRLISVDKNS